MKKIDELIQQHTKKIDSIKKAAEKGTKGLNVNVENALKRQLELYGDLQKQIKKDLDQFIHDKNSSTEWRNWLNDNRHLVRNSREFDHANNIPAEVWIPFILENYAPPHITQATKKWVIETLFERPDLRRDSYTGSIIF